MRSLHGHSWRTAALSAWMVMASVTASFAQDTVSAVKVVEEWELVVSQPDPTVDAPQVTTVIAPVGNLNSVHAAFELNHQSQPSFVAGGMQLQLWNGETPLYSKKHKEGQRLTSDNETITWSQEMILHDGYLTFVVRNGSSTSWGSFGGLFSTSGTVATSLQNLNGYNPMVSVNNSGVGFAGNRVASLKLLRVCVHTADGQVVEDATVRTAFPKE